MLKIPKSAEYALLALKFISEEKRLVNVKEISDSVTIPYELLAKILQKLSKYDVVESVQGTKGGYLLKQSPSEIKLSVIMEALDQNIKMTDCMVENPSLSDCKRVKECCLVNPVKNIQHKINKLLDELSLDAII